MSDHPEQDLAKEKSKAIRDYLTQKFPDCAIDEFSTLTLWYTFIVTDVKSHKYYKLQVSEHRLSGRSNTPEKIRAELDRFDVAGKMIAANGGFYTWA